MEGYQPTDGPIHSIDETLQVAGSQTANAASNVSLFGGAGNDTQSTNAGDAETSGVTLFGGNDSLGSSSQVSLPSASYAYGVPVPAQPVAYGSNSPSANAPLVAVPMPVPVSNDQLMMLVQLQQTAQQQIAQSAKDIISIFNQLGQPVQTKLDEAEQALGEIITQLNTITKYLLGQQTRPLKQITNIVSQPVSDLIAMQQMSLAQVADVVPPTSIPALGIFPIPSGHTGLPAPVVQEPGIPSSGLPYPPGIAAPVWNTGAPSSPQSNPAIDIAMGGPMGTVPQQQTIAASYGSASNELSGAAFLYPGANQASQSGPQLSGYQGQVDAGAKGMPSAQQPQTIQPPPVIQPPSVDQQYANQAQSQYNPPSGLDTSTPAYNAPDASSINTLGDAVVALSEAITNGFAMICRCLNYGAERPVPTPTTLHGTLPPADIWAREGAEPGEPSNQAAGDILDSLLAQFSGSALGGDYADIDASIAQEK